MNPAAKPTTEAMNDQSAVYVDENRNVIKGHRAVELIEAKGPELVDPTKGVVRVNQSRWQEAQRYERRTWMEGTASMSDRNEDHESCFGNYRSIGQRHFNTAIELGCGPFTNLRKILRHCSVEAITLLDPLASDYLGHPFCRYKKSRFGGILNTSWIPWSRRGGIKHPLRFYKHKLDEWRIGGLAGRPVELRSSGIEDFKVAESYDLCVMINVIEHCRDVEQIFARILEMTHPGSVFVFADKIYDAAVELDLARIRYDAGHPLRVDHSILEEFLRANFRPVWNAEVEEHEGQEEYQCLYFIGERRSNV